MQRLLLITFSLFALTAASLLIVLATSFSTAVWGCLRFTTLTSTGVLNVADGSYFIEQPFAPAPYVDAVTYVPINAGQWIYYEFVSASGRQRNGVVDAARSHGHLDGWVDFPTTIYSVSPDHRYLAFTAIDITTRQQALTIYDSATFAQIAKVHLDGNLPSRTIRTATSGTNDADWSPSGAWFAVTSITSNVPTLSLVSLQTGESQHLPLASVESWSRFFWSSDGTALAVLGGGDVPFPSMYRKVDVLTLHNGLWQVVYSFDTNVVRSAPYQEGRLDQAAWNSAGDTFSIFRLRPQRGSGYEMISVRLGEPTIATITALENTFTPVFALRGDWYCTPEQGNDLYALRPLSPNARPYHLETYCGSGLTSPDGNVLIAKHRDSTDSPTGKWIALRASPFSVVPLPTAELPISINDTRWLQWSADNQFAFFFVPILATQDMYDAHLVVIDTRTGRWLKVQQPISMNLYPAIAPDSSRFAVWSADRQNVLVFDMENHLIATINGVLTNPNSVLLDWSPDSTRLLVYEAYLMGAGTISIFDRDGRPLANFPRPTLSQAWLVNSDKNGWTHCEPSPKLPRLNLPQ